MEDNHSPNTSNDTKSIIIVLGIMLFIGLVFYFNKIRPDSIKQKCKDQVYADVRGRFTAEELATKDGLKLANWVLNIKYIACLANHGIFNQF